MKMLYILNYVNRINSFSLASIRAAKELGIDFHIASSWGYLSEAEKREDEERYGVRIHQIDFVRSPYDLRNKAAMGQLMELIAGEQFDLIHCNTPIGGVLGRLAAKKCGIKRVIYQAHGFHFYKGAPLLNWLAYYSVEKWLARCTDAVITINQEDFALAKEKLRPRGAGKVYYVPGGVGVDLKEFDGRRDMRRQTRENLNLSDTDVMLLSAGELNGNKNQTVIISALSKLNRGNIHYFLCGVGDKERALRGQAERAGLGRQVHFLGYRQDMKALLQAADIFVMPSYREGLSRSIMEAMASGLPCVVSRIRGNVDLIREGEGGYLCPPEDAEGFAGAIAALEQEPERRERMGAHNLERIRQYDASAVAKEIMDIYSEVLMNARSERHEGFTLITHRPLFWR